ncbi:MAG: class I SAM-dependent methyltransferase [Actinomycetota bacterium]|nr:class I SAM-dependent methyltransferase [Actinomycetota bacterium]
MQDATRERFARTADRIAALQDARAEELEAKVVRFVAPAGDERVLDSGSGAGALAFALAPHVRAVVAVDLVPELLEQGRTRGERFPNVSFVEGDATKLSFEPFSFDLAGSLRTLHHIARPELAVAELARVTRPGGRVLVVDQIASVDPVAAAELNAFERARDPSHARALADIDLRHLFESNELVLLRSEYETKPRDLDPYLDLAGCEGEARERAESLAPTNYTAQLGWYLLEKR